jgi:hypothetical protein
MRTHSAELQPSGSSSPSIFYGATSQGGLLRDGAALVASLALWAFQGHSKRHCQVNSAQAIALLLSPPCLCCLPVHLWLVASEGAGRAREAMQAVNVRIHLPLGHAMQ